MQFKWQTSENALGCDCLCIAEEVKNTLYLKEELVIILMNSNEIAFYFGFW